jgi:hypothetical protein
MIKALAFTVCFLAACTFAGTAFAWTIGPNSFEVLTYQDSDYRFLVIPRDAKPPAGFEQPGFDDSAFGSGSAAFGSGGSCPLQQTDQTSWLINTQLLVRRIISIPAGATNVNIRVSVDNDIIGVFFNGTRLQGPIRHEGCPIRDQVFISVPQKLVQPGQNLVAFDVLDRGVESFFDARILADIPENVATFPSPEQALFVPIRDLDVTCNDSSDIKEATVSFTVEATGDVGQLTVRSTTLEDFDVAAALRGKPIARIREEDGNSTLRLMRIEHLSKRGAWTGCAG